MSDDAVKTTPKLSPVEGIKTSSHQLRGAIGSEMVDANDHFGHDSEVLLKFHGTYQQDDRDQRHVTNDDGTKSSKGRSHIFMVRTRIPGGKLTSEQLLAELDLCDELANSTLRITSRQGLQLHGVLKQNLKASIKRINDIQLTTLAACGDVNRNVMACPAPYKSPIYDEMQSLAYRLAEHFKPRTTAYHELWLTDVATGEKKLVGGESENGSHAVNEPIYGERYLPRKFKMAIGLPHDNCVDIHANDLGFLAIIENNAIVGWNLIAGGGMGMTPSNKKTYAFLGVPLCFATTSQVIAAAEAVVKVQRDFGNREDRKQARLKYTIAKLTLPGFKQKVEEYFGGKLAEPKDVHVSGFNDHMGWDEQGDGKWFYGLNVENGRIKDDDTMSLKTAIREVCRTLKPGIRLTSHQSILFTDIAVADKPRLEAILRKHRVKLTEEISLVRRWSMACVAWPTCGLSITESERALPGIIDQMEVALAQYGLSNEKFTVRMTGCPNGCARPYNCDIGLVGKARGKYTILVGGRLLGDRLNFVYQDMIPEDDVVKTLSPVFAYFKQSRLDGESLGDFCHRKGKEDLLSFAAKFGA